MNKWSPVNVFVLRTPERAPLTRACEVPICNLERAATAPSKENRSHFVWSNSLPLKSSPHSSTAGGFARLSGRLTVLFLRERD